MNKQAVKYKISPKGKRKLDYPTKSSKSKGKLPLIGKTIYLDVKDPKHVKRLQQDLKKLGATLEEFVSRDINYLITSQPRPKHKDTNPCGDENPSPSPFNCDPSPSPGCPDEKKVTSVTRGKALAEKARYTRQASTLLDNAEKWGVKIVSLEGAFKWIDKELKKLPKSVGNLSKKSSRTKCVSSYKIIKSPYVKLEGQSFCYRPFHLELDVWPRLNVDTPRGSCPFDGTLIKGGDDSREERGELLAAQVDIPSEDTPKEEKDGCESAVSTPKPTADKAAKKSESDTMAGSRILTAGELKRRKDLKRKQERKRGYCECCRVKYEDLDKHVKEEQHRHYVKNKSNYLELDALITSGQDTSKFLYEYLTKAANLTSTKILNGAQGNKGSATVTRRSPRKTVQEQTIKSIIKSPRKNTHQPMMDSVTKSPKRSVETQSLTVRVSPRKNLQKLMNVESGDSKLKQPVANTGVSKPSPTCRTRKNNDSMQKAESNGPNLVASGQSGKTSSAIQKSKKQESVLQKEGNVLSGCDNKDFSNQKTIEDTNMEKRKDLPIEKQVEKHDQSPSKTLSPINVRNRVFSKSPSRRVTRKLLIESVEQENAENDRNVLEDADKENKSPVEHENKKSVDHRDNKKHSENGNNDEPKDKIVNKVNSSQHVTCRETVYEKDNDEIYSSGELKHSSDKSDISLEKRLTSDVLNNFELTKAGFTEIVKCGRNRTKVEHSSDDFEVCFARSLENETLPELKKAGTIADNTFDEFVDQCENVKEMNKVNDAKGVSSKCLNDENEHLTKTKKSPIKKPENVALPHVSVSVKQLPLEFVRKYENIKMDNESVEKKRDTYDINEQSDIPSDFQCYDEQGTIMTFSKTLAERIKERSLGRRSSVESYNLKVLFQMPAKSRSNSFSSNNSDQTSQKISDKKTQSRTKKVANKKTVSSIASAKVVNKYRNRRIGIKLQENCQTGYQGDDENEQTSISKETRLNQTYQGRRKKFWHYEPVMDDDDTGNDEQMRGLPKLLKELKVKNAWFSSDNSDTESRRTRMQERYNAKTELEMKENINDKENEGRDIITHITAEGNVDQNISNSYRNKEVKKVNEKKIKKPNQCDKSKEGPELVKDDCVECKGKHTRTKKKRFWYYVAEENGSDTGKEEDIDKDLPRELRKLKASSDQLLPPSESRRARKTCNIKEANSGKALIEKDNVENEIPVVENENLVKKGLEGNKDKIENCRKNIKEVDKEKANNGKKGKDVCKSSFDCADEIKCQSLETSVDKVVEKRKGRFWDIVVVEEKSDEEDDENLPKELRHLKYSRADRFSIETSNTRNKHDKRRGRNKKQINLRRRSNVDYCESDCTESDRTETDSGENERTETDSDENERTKTDSDENEPMSISVKKKNNCHETSMVLDWRRQRPEIDYRERNESDIEPDFFDDNAHGIDNEKHSKVNEGNALQTKESVDKNKKSEMKVDSDTGAGYEEGKTKCKSKRSKFWEYVTVTENEVIEQIEEASLPKELRHLKQNSFWPSGSGTSRRSTSNSRKKEKRKTVESEILGCEGKRKATDFVRSEVSESAVVKNVEDKIDAVNEENIKRKNEDKSNTDEVCKTVADEVCKTVDSDTGRSRSRSMKHKVFWEYKEVPVDDNEDTVDTSLPKELQFLKDAWNDFSVLQGTSRRSTSHRKNEKGKTVESEILGCGGRQKATDIVRSEVSECAVVKNVENKIDNVNEENIKSKNENKCNTDEVCKTVADEVCKIVDSDTGRSRSRSMKRKVFWEYKEVPVDDNDDTVDTSLPKELQILKDSWNDFSVLQGTSRRSTSNSKKNEKIKTVESKILGCEGRRKATDFVRSEVSESAIVKNVENKIDDVDEENIKRKNENKCNRDEVCKTVADEVCKTVDSDTGRSRSRSKKRKVFWEYKEVPIDAVDDNEDKVDTSLPKELQILKDSWNDFSVVQGRRSRSCQSNSDVSDVANKNHVTNKQVRKAKQHTGVAKENLLQQSHKASHKKEGKLFVKNVSTESKETKGIKQKDAEIYSLEKGERLNELSYDEMYDNENARSTSPVFNVVSNPQIKVPRRKSPVFNRSPRQKMQAGKGIRQSDYGRRKRHRIDNKKYAVKGKIATPKSGLTVQGESPENIAVVVDLERNLENINSEEFCSDSEDDIARTENITDGKSDVTVRTPEKSIPTVEPGSGYSTTPREKRRKQWKRKQMETDSVHQEEKKRKLEHSNQAEEKNTYSPRSTPRRRLLEPSCSDNNDGLGNKNCADLNILTETKMHAGHENVDNQFSLTWNLANTDATEKKCEKVKLNRSWTMLSDRSVTKLLSTENNNENFEGFTDEDKLSSDMSFEEKSEVEIQNDDKHEWVLEDDKSENEENLVQYVPVFFPSPNKTSNSSWNDAIEGYIDSSLRHGPESSFRGENSMYFSFKSSPRKSPAKCAFGSPSKTFGVVKSPMKSYKPSTPKRNKQVHGQSPEVKRVDNEIEFNFGSPQKNCSSFSPLRKVNGVVKNLSSSVNLTSTPVLKNSKKQKHKKH